MMATSVPMTGPSTDMSAKMAAAWLTVLVAMVRGRVGYCLIVRVAAGTRGACEGRKSRRTEDC
jgi:hypothetical protein